MYNAEKHQLIRHKITMIHFRAGAAGFAIEEYIFWIYCILVISELKKNQEISE